MSDLQNKIERRRIGRLINDIQNRIEVEPDNIKTAFEWILSSDTEASNFLWGSMFSALQTRGVNESEILALLEAAASYDNELILDNSKKPRLKVGDKKVVAITGSGKDNFKTFNLSTAAAMTASSLGVCVIKPGSSALSSNSGALDILKALKIELLTEEAHLIEVAKKYNLCIFSFTDRLAKYGERYGKLFYSFHPLSYIMPAVAIPYQVDGIVYGIADKNVSLAASVLNGFQYERAAAVSTELKPRIFTDEFIPFGVSRVGMCINKQIVTRKYVNKYIESDEEDSLAPGFSHKENAQILVHALNGQRGPAATAAISRATGVLLALAGKSESITEGTKLAAAAINSGKVMDHVTSYATATRNLSAKKKKSS